jgi:hypothetical protein
MTEFATIEAAVARAGAPTADAGYAAHVLPAADVKTGDDGADPTMLQRLQQTASQSVRAQQLKRQSEMMAASPATASLQRLRQMANNSPQALQLKQHAERITAAASGETGPPPFRAHRQRWHRIGPVVPGAAEVAEVSGAVLQAVWEPDADRKDLYRWDAVIDGKQWYYDPSNDKYHYIVVNSRELTFAGLADAFDVKSDCETDRSFMTDLVLDKAYCDFSYGFYFNEADEDALHRFDTKSLRQPLTDRASVHCLNYIFTDDPSELEKAAAAEIGNEEAEFYGGMASIALKGAFNFKLAETHFKKDEREQSFGLGRDQYGTGDGGYWVSRTEAAKLTLRRVLRPAIWAAMSHEIGSIVSKDKLESPDTVLDVDDRVTVGNMTVRFTPRVSPLRRGHCVALIEKFQDVIADLDATRLKAAVTDDMTPTFSRALQEKNKGLGHAPNAGGSTEVAVEIAKSGMLTEEKLTAYAVATVRRWRALLNSRIMVVFDAAGYAEVYGKTPTLPGATPANMMTGPAAESGKEPGLPESTYVLINVDSPDNIVTLAHELAHVAGYNPTDVERSGHFTDSTSYGQAETKYGPKLLFDAYYFEVLFRRLAGV